MVYKVTVELSESVIEDLYKAVGRAVKGTPTSVEVSLSLRDLLMAYSETVNENITLKKDVHELNNCLANLWTALGLPEKPGNIIDYDELFLEIQQLVTERAKSDRFTWARQLYEDFAQTDADESWDVQTLLVETRDLCFRSRDLVDEQAKHMKRQKAKIAELNKLVEKHASDEWARSMFDQIFVLCGGEPGKWGDPEDVLVQVQTYQANSSRTHRVTAACDDCPYVKGFKDALSEVVKQFAKTKG